MIKLALRQKRSISPVVLYFNGGNTIAAYADNGDAAFDNAVRAIMAAYIRRAAPSLATIDRRIIDKRGILAADRADISACRRRQYELRGRIIARFDAHRAAAPALLACAKPLPRQRRKARRWR